jgi:hypothetical protein
MNGGRLFDPLLLFGALLAIVWGGVAVVGILGSAERGESLPDDDLSDCGPDGEPIPDPSNELSSGVEKDSSSIEARDGSTSMVVAVRRGKRDG